MAKKIKKTRLDTGKLEVLVAIVNSNKTDSTLDLLQSFEVNMQLAIPAEGTASVEALEVLGLDSIDKTVILCAIREDRAPDALAAFEKRFTRIRDGKGIAYTIPMSSVIGLMIFGFLSNDRRTVKTDN